MFVPSDAQKMHSIHNAPGVPVEPLDVTKGNGAVAGSEHRFGGPVPIPTVAHDEVPAACEFFVRLVSDESHGMSYSFGHLPRQGDGDVSVLSHHGTFEPTA